MTYVYWGLIIGLSLTVGILLSMLSSRDKKIASLTEEYATCQADLDLQVQMNNQNNEEYAKLAQAKTVADIEAARVIADGEREEALLRAKLLEIGSDKDNGPIPPNLQRVTDWVRQDAASHH